MASQCGKRPIGVKLMSTCTSVVWFRFPVSVSGFRFRWGQFPPRRGSGLVSVSGFGFRFRASDTECPTGPLGGPTANEGPEAVVSHHRGPRGPLQPLLLRRATGPYNTECPTGPLGGPTAHEGPVAVASHHRGPRGPLQPLLLRRAAGPLQYRKPRGERRGAFCELV